VRNALYAAQGSPGRGKSWNRREQDNLANGTKIEALRRIRALGILFGDTGKRPTLGLPSWRILFRRVGAIYL
jgi:hypothetical protein